MTASAEQEVRALVMVQLDAAKRRGDLITSELIAAKIEATANYVQSIDPDTLIDRQNVLKDLEADFNVHVANWTAIGEDKDHVVWLPSRQDEIDWRFWARYERYLRDVKKMPRASVERLDEITGDVLGRLESPHRPGAWDRRGLVAGQVQSGKTGNYIGLICKAIDAGYKLVVVLAGVHNSLRSQTQARIDEGVLGFDTRKGLRFDKVDLKVGVGKMAGPFLHVNSFTSSEQNGDFNMRVAQNIGVAVGGNDPVVLVVKKYKSVLTNLHEWATKLREEVDPETGRRIVRDVPVLLIDDEADNASVDTKRPKRGADSDEYDPSVINGLIRKFLYTFEQSAYVGYTATPFANIFINPDAKHEEAGDDIFPRSFIINLPAASNYIGPARVFGLQENAAAGIEEVESLPIVRLISDYDAWMPDGHKSDHRPEEPLPASLKRALEVYLLATAVRFFRGQIGEHNTMLVHVTRFTRVQKVVAEQIRETLDSLRRVLVLDQGEVRDELWENLREVYSTELLDTSKELGSFEDLQEQLGEFPHFDDLYPHLKHALEITQVRTVNGTSADAFEYIDHPTGISVVAVGGDKLSRGLTLEGLTISYYLRASKMYDTLMQMGRWFGYRPGYLDVCRLYTTKELRDWYVAITAATEELTREFDYMAATGRTPREFGLRVKQHPDGLLVTSPAKLRHARQLSISYAGTISESIIFNPSSKARTRNWHAVRDLVDQMDRSQARRIPKDNGSVLWRSVSPALITAFLGSYEAHADSLKAQPKALIDYINSRTSDDPAELTDWWVLLVSNSNTKNVRPVNGENFGLITRALHPAPEKSASANIEPLKRYSIRRLLSPSDERIDFGPESDGWKVALNRTKEAWAKSTRTDKSEKEPTAPSGLSIRAVRPPSRGLLVLYLLDPSEALLDQQADPFVGFAASFPASMRAKPVTYQVNPVFWSRELGYLDDDDEDA